MPIEGFEIRGYREAISALRKVDRAAYLGLLREIRLAALAVQQQAERLARENIANIGDNWSQMRTGATSRYVYVAPKQRRGGGSPRPNLAELLMTEALIPAAEPEQELLAYRVEALVGTAIAESGL